MTEQKPCWECSKRRRVCDFARPACQKMSLQSAECPGYDKKPLKCYIPARQDPRASEPRTSLLLSLPPALPPWYRLACLIIKLAIIESIKYCTPAYLMCLSNSEFVHFCPSLTFCLFCLDNMMVCPDLVALGDANTGSPFFIPLDYVSYIPPGATESIICVALGHRILQLRDRLDSKSSVVLVKRLQDHEDAPFDCSLKNIAKHHVKLLMRLCFQFSCSFSQRFVR